MHSVFHSQSSLRRESGTPSSHCFLHVVAFHRFRINYTYIPTRFYIYFRTSEDDVDVKLCTFGSGAEGETCKEYLLDKLLLL